MRHFVPRGAAPEWSPSSALRKTHALMCHLPCICTCTRMKASWRSTDQRLRAVQHHLQHEALHFQHEKQSEIRVGLVNIISDSITLATFLITLAARNEGRELLTNTIGRITQVRRHRDADAFLCFPRRHPLCLRSGWPRHVGVRLSLHAQRAAPRLPCLRPFPAHIVLAAP